jgi:hypothetical protein
MDTFGHVAGRNPMPSVFREVLRRKYGPPDEPLSPRMEELLERLNSTNDGEVVPAEK